MGGGQDRWIGSEDNGCFSLAQGCFSPSFPWMVVFILRIVIFLLRGTEAGTERGSASGFESRGHKPEAASRTSCCLFVVYT